MDTLTFYLEPLRAFLFQIGAFVPRAGVRDPGRDRGLADRQGGALRGHPRAACDQFPRADRARRHRQLPASGRHGDGLDRGLRRPGLLDGDPGLAGGGLQRAGPELRHRPARPRDVVRAECLRGHAGAGLRGLLRQVRGRRRDSPMAAMRASRTPCCWARWRSTQSCCSWC